MKEFLGEKGSKCEWERLRRRRRRQAVTARALQGVDEAVNKRVETREGERDRGRESMI